MFNSVSIYLVLFLLASFFRVSGQKYNFNFDHIGMEDGLPARMVYYIAQDQEGFIWLSTQLGVHRFDGQYFKTYSNPSMGLPSRHPPHLAVDGQNRLWMSCTIPYAARSKTLVLDIEADRIYSVAEATNGLLNEADIMGVAPTHISEQGVLIIRPDGALLHYDEGIEHCGDFYPGKGGILKAGRKGTYWFWNRIGLQEIQKGKEVHIHDYSHLAPQHPSLNPFLPEDPIIWTARPTSHWSYSIIDHQIQPIAFPGISPEQMRHPITVEEDYFIYAGRDGFYACQSDGQLLASSPAFLDHTASDENRVFDVLKDRQSNIWVTTVDGVYKISVQPNYFTPINKGFSTHGIFPDGNRLWATCKEYFSYWHVPSQQRHILAEEFLLNSFFKTSDNQIWGLARGGKLLRYDPQGTKLDVFSSPTLVSIMVALEMGQEKVLWLGTNHGVYKTAPLDQLETPYHLELLPGQKAQPAMTVRSLVKRNREVWAGGTQGLMLFDAESGQLLRSIGASEGLPFVDLNHVHIDSSGLFWLASRGGGLIRWNPEDGEFRQFTTQDGLSNDNIYAAIEDDKGALWLPSDYGLMCFDKESHDVRVFHKGNGLLHEEFNTLSHAKDSVGNLYFGGLQGVIRFHPDSLSPLGSTAGRQLKATEIRVLKDGAESYENKLSAYAERHQLELDPDDQLIEFKVSNLDFVGSLQKDLAYRLKGYHNNWIYPEGNLITLMNPPYGTYALEVKARSASGTWLPPSLSIPILVQRPFYYKTWFWLVSVLGLCLAFWGILQLRIRSLKRSRKRMELEVQKRTQTISLQAEKLEELSHAKSRFFSNITHEFRTPLTLIIGPLKQILRAPMGKDTPLKLQGILRNSQSLLHLINQLLDISKLEHGKMEVEKKHGDIVYFTQDLLAPFGHVAQIEGIELRFQASAASIALEFDQDKWEKVLNNLLSNALKFTPPGGKIDVKLSLEENADSRQLRLLVRDTGRGIPPQDLNKVFDRFYQPGQASNKQGTGIGLALVKELVELQGGQVAVQSQLEQGSSFEITLPVQAPALLPTAKSSPTEKLRLLLIEDHADLRAYIRSCFDPAVYEIWEAPDGAAGVSLAQELVPDLIISDVMMPRMDGYAVTQALRQHLATSHIPIVMLTAKASLESRLEGLRSGADAYLSKPFSPEELVLRVEKLIAIRDLYKERFRPSKDIHQIQESLPPQEELDPSELFMADLKAFIRENLSNPDLKVSLIVRHFGISRAQFYRKLQSLSDVGVPELIRSARCEAALHLIRRQEFTMAEIAYEIGFSSPSQFSRSFKSHFGRSPKEIQSDLLETQNSLN